MAEKISVKNNCVALIDNEGYLKIIFYENDKYAEKLNSVLQKYKTEKFKFVALCENSMSLISLENKIMYENFIEDEEDEDDTSSSKDEEESDEEDEEKTEKFIHPPTDLDVNFIRLDFGYDHYMAFSDTNVLVCWGSNKEECSNPGKPAVKGYSAGACGEEFSVVIKAATKDKKTVVKTIGSEDFVKKIPNVEDFKKVLVVDQCPKMLRKNCIIQ